MLPVVVPKRNVQWVMQRTVQSKRTGEESTCTFQGHNHDLDEVAPQLGSEDLPTIHEDP